MSREAWARRYANQARPWTGPVHAAPLLEGLSGRIVELGAAGGKVRAALPRDTLGIDWVRPGLAAPALVADVRALPLADASVDALVAVHVLGHIAADERARTIREWARVLRPGGTLIIEVFASGDARAGSGTPTEPGTWVRGGVATHHFDADELSILLRGWDGAWALDERHMRWGVRRAWRGRFIRR